MRKSENGHKEIGGEGKGLWHVETNSRRRQIEPLGGGRERRERSKTMHGV